VAVLQIAPTPELGRQLSRAKIAAALGRGGRQRNLQGRAAQIQAALGSAQLAAPQPISHAYGRWSRPPLPWWPASTSRSPRWRRRWARGFNTHPDAKTIRSLPGLGMVLGARVLGEFGDDQTRFPTAKSRKNYAGSAPITKASGRSLVVLARHARNRRLADALDQWAFCSLTRSPRPPLLRPAPGPEQDPPTSPTPACQPMVGILHTCLERGIVYDEHLAWSHLQPTAA
jgi:hypothetical protein